MNEDALRRGNKQGKNTNGNYRTMELFVSVTRGLNKAIYIIQQDKTGRGVQGTTNTKIPLKKVYLMCE